MMVLMMNLQVVFSFNINIVECKYTTAWALLLMSAGFNINIVECKLHYRSLSHTQCLGF